VPLITCFVCASHDRELLLKNQHRKFQRRYYVNYITFSACNQTARPSPFESRYAFMRYRYLNRPRTFFAHTICCRSQSIGKIGGRARVSRMLWHTWEGICPNRFCSYLDRLGGGPRRCVYISCTRTDDTVVFIVLVQVPCDIERQSSVYVYIHLTSLTASSPVFTWNHGECV
jgi:hypothetical protein